MKYERDVCPYDVLLDVTEDMSGLAAIIACAIAGPIPVDVRPPRADLEFPAQLIQSRGDWSKVRAVLIGYLRHHLAKLEADTK